MLNLGYRIVISANGSFYTLGPVKQVGLRIKFKNLPPIAQEENASCPC